MVKLHPGRALGLRDLRTPRSCTSSIIKEYSRRHLQVPNQNIFVSLERRMKCGVGKCGHCQINGLYVCQDRPVFRYKELFYLQEAL